MFQRIPGDRDKQFYDDHKSEFMRKSLINLMVPEEEQEEEGKDDENKEDEEEDNEDREGDDKDDKIAKEFLEMFEISSESNPNLRIDIILMLKAIPIEISKNNINQVKKFQLRTLQQSFVAYKNADQGDAFEHYDNLNNNRVQMVREIELNKYENLLIVNDKIFNQISEKVQNAENILKEFEEMWERWEIMK